MNSYKNFPCNVLKSHLTHTEFVVKIWTFLCLRLRSSANCLIKRHLIRHLIWHLIRQFYFYKGLIKCPVKFLFIRQLADERSQCIDIKAFRFSRRTVYLRQNNGIRAAGNSKCHKSLLLWKLKIKILYEIKLTNGHSRSVSRYVTVKIF